MKTNNPLLKLKSLGQSVWLDSISRPMLTSGVLKRLIVEDGLSGVTSNPAIFEKAIAETNDYDEDIRTLAGEGKGVDDIYQNLVVRDIMLAADQLRGIYDRLDGRDGFVSLEVSPRLAHDMEKTVKEAERLWAAVDRPNVFIKVPATTEGLPAIRQLIGEGININVTLLFGLPRYREVARAYIAGLEDRIIKGKPIDHVASVASFFLSRIDTMIDPILEKKAEAGGKIGLTAASLIGEAAISSAKVAYKIFKEIFRSASFSYLAQTGRQGAATAVGKYEHQESGLQRCEVRRAPHRSGDGQHGPDGDAPGLPGPRQACRQSGERLVKSRKSPEISQRSWDQYRPGDPGSRG